LDNYLRSAPEITEKLAFACPAAKPAELFARREEEMKSFLEQWSLDWSQRRRE